MCVFVTLMVITISDYIVVRLINSWSVNPLLYNLASIMFAIGKKDVKFSPKETWFLEEELNEALKSSPIKTPLM